MLEQKAKLKQHKAAPKRAEKTTMAAQKCATEKKLRYFCRTKGIDVYKFKEQQTAEQQTDEQQTVELTTFITEVSSGRRNER